MLDLHDINTAEKAASWSGKGVYYAFSDGSAWVIEPDTGRIIRCTMAHFKRYYLPFSASMPQAIRERLQALPPFREWKRQFQCAKK